MKHKEIGVVVMLCIVLFLYMTLSADRAVFVERPRRYTVGIVLLNYNRPHNLSKSLPILTSYNMVDQIVVSHGHPDFTDTSFQHQKVVHVRDYQNNKLYGGGRRVHNVQHAKTDFVLFLDDDFIPSECIIAEMYNTLLEKDTLVGPIARTCNSSGYNMNIIQRLITGHRQNVVLIGLSMCRKSLVKEYLDKGFPEYESWLIEHHGNCEDLAFNAFLAKKGTKPFILNNSSYEELDRSEGYSALSDHMKIRSDFCKLHFA